MLLAGEKPEEGFHAYDILQGVEIGRSSLIRLGLQVTAGELTAVTIGGGAVIVSEGMLHV